MPAMAQSPRQGHLEVPSLNIRQPGWMVCGQAPLRLAAAHSPCLLGCQIQVGRSLCWLLLGVNLTRP